jgi:hypothetical protein
MIRLHDGEFVREPAGSQGLPIEALLDTSRPLRGARRLHPRRGGRHDRDRRAWRWRGLAAGAATGRSSPRPRRATRSSRASWPCTPWASIEAGLYWEDVSDLRIDGSYAEEGHPEFTFEAVMGDEVFRERDTFGNVRFDNWRQRDEDRNSPRERRRNRRGDRGRAALREGAGQSAVPQAPRAQERDRAREVDGLAQRPSRGRGPQQRKSNATARPRNPASGTPAR